MFYVAVYQINIAGNNFKFVLVDRMFAVSLVKYDYFHEIVRMCSRFEFGRNYSDILFGVDCVETERYVIVFIFCGYWFIHGIIIRFLTKKVKCDIDEA